MAEINLQKTIYPKNFNKVVNQNFSQLIKPTLPTITEAPTVAEFFILYDELFYQIPKQGDVNSHQQLVDKSSDYLGISPTDVDGLLAEITVLRQQLIDANQQINELIANGKN